MAGRSSRTRKRSAERAQAEETTATLIQDEVGFEFADGDPNVIVGHRVPADVAGTSGLLSGIGSTNGLTSLPHSISPEDVRLWLAACVLDTQPSTEELITVLKVRSHGHGQETHVTSARIRNHL